MNRTDAVEEAVRRGANVRRAKGGELLLTSPDGKYRCVIGDPGRRGGHREIPNHLKSFLKKLEVTGG